MFSLSFEFIYNLRHIDFVQLQGFR